MDISPSLPENPPEYYDDSLARELERWRAYKDTVRFLAARARARVLTFDFIARLESALPVYSDGMPCERERMRMNG